MNDRNKTHDLDNCTALKVIDFYVLLHYIEEPFSDFVQQIYLMYKKNNLNLASINN